MLYLCNLTAGKRTKQVRIKATSIEAADRKARTMCGHLNTRILSNFRQAGKMIGLGFVIRKELIPIWRATVTPHTQHRTHHDTSNQLSTSSR